MDVKKKELIGNFHRSGTLQTLEPIRVNDHDFESLADGKVIPHGRYDLYQNIGYVILGTHHDTSEFACTGIRRWWLNHGQFDYPKASSMLILCDCGGSNNARYYIFKQDLLRLAEELGIEIRIAHYPPYTSKYNPIEHRLFCHLTRVCKGVIFTNLELVRELMNQTTTTTGLKVLTTILDKAFETGRKVTKDFKQNIPIHFDDFLPKWNYVAKPSTTGVGEVIKS